MCVSIILRIHTEMADDAICHRECNSDTCTRLRAVATCFPPFCWVFKLNCLFGQLVGACSSPIKCQKSRFPFSFLITTFPDSIWFDFLFLPLYEHVFCRGPWRLGRWASGGPCVDPRDILGAILPHLVINHQMHLQYNILHTIFTGRRHLPLSPNEILARVVCVEGCLSRP